VRFNIANNDRVGTNLDIIAYSNTTEHLGTGKDRDIVAELGNPVHGTVTNGHPLKYGAPGSKLSIPRNEDPVGMWEGQPRTNLRAR
jgi:hypothetical protein